MKTRRLLLLLLAAAAIAAFFVFDLGRYLSLDVLKARQEALQAYAAMNPLRSAAIFFGIYVGATALSIPGAVILTLAAGAVFGLWRGLLIVSFASAIGATLAFLAARFLLRDFVTRRFGDRLKAIDQGIARDGAFYLFTLRLVPLFPFFLINLLMGLTNLPALTFYWVSQVGMLAGTAVYVNAGTQLAQLESVRGILSPGLLLSFALLGIFPLAAKKAVDIYKARKVYAKWPKPRKTDYNMVVIGAGSAGLVSAYIAAAVKAKVALVERHRMGGDCLNTGCVPSKALIKSARLMSQIGKAGNYGLSDAHATVDFAAVMDRVRHVIAEIEPHDSVERYAGLGVETVGGDARIVSPFAVEVTLADGGKRTLTTRSIVIAAGARPFVPPIPGLDQVGCLTSDTLWELRELPRRLLVLGGGPIGCELAQAFARLGSQVTQVEMSDRLMAREDAEVSELVAARFRAEGIQVMTGHKAERFLVEGGEKMLIASHAGGELRIPFDALLCAVGRVANTAGYGLEELGIPVTKARTVETDDYLQTLYPNILAAGDVAGPYQFTHVAAHQAWYAAVNGLFGRFRRFKADYSVIPWATFVEPEVARVGLNEQDAKEKNVAYEVTRYDIGELDRAIADGVAHGWVKVLTVPGKDKILGATIVGEHAGDLIAEYVLAMKHGLGMNKLLGTIHIYPTLAEANKYAAGNWKRAHAPERLLEWVRRFHAWQRG
ncbi:FAD-dependent oxidoreductase [Noviherbaspirillum suwonense]|uniref:Pyruvate/2-oxoglutarate dehydrogenase complex, dihydrolipoamide dehydrogenase (E3) component n=1 Tax=Noviherbaspirillum suwonense TaxID=1224511 RepID=A0ABY1PSR4_9BURK|nr:bifunctional TVP38/TMEM64 family protein/FAD-dependent oxidoreductase [Noviherbaspirillum suwonense]SMP44006.1 Pyruvate/2-oxoglutarate dehydrogenase complex, dihydrolipoamide dehydrogenase (E3) component [Noviherbaspirillum suwonense]